MTPLGRLAWAIVIFCLVVAAAVACGAPSPPMHTALDSWVSSAEETPTWTPTPKLSPTPGPAAVTPGPSPAPTTRALPTVMSEPGATPTIRAPSVGHEQIGELPVYVVCPYTDVESERPHFAGCSCQVKEPDGSVATYLCATIRIIQTLSLIHI